MTKKIYTCPVESCGYETDEPYRLIMNDNSIYCEKCDAHSAADDWTTKPARTEVERDWVEGDKLIDKNGTTIIFSNYVGNIKDYFMGFTGNSCCCDGWQLYIEPIQSEPKHGNSTHGSDNVKVLESWSQVGAANCPQSDNIDDHLPEQIEADTSTAEGYLKVFDAWRNGEVIQFKNPDGKWFIETGHPWTWETSDLYRIKPEEPQRVVKIGDLWRDGHGDIYWVLSFNNDHMTGLYKSDHGWRVHSQRTAYLDEYLGHVDLSILETPET